VGPEQRKMWSPEPGTQCAGLPDQCRYHSAMRLQATPDWVTIIQLRQPHARALKRKCLTLSFHHACQLEMQLTASFQAGISIALQQPPQISGLLEAAMRPAAKKPLPRDSHPGRLLRSSALSPLDYRDAEVPSTCAELIKAAYFSNTNT